MVNDAKVFLISGRTGAGKTVISNKIASEKKAFRISHDEWLRIIFGPEIEQEKLSERCGKINQLIWNQVELLSNLGIDVILEGWGSRRLRDEARKKLEGMNISYEFIYIDCPAEERWLRVQKRNKSISEEGFHFSREDFERMEKIKEEFDEDEPVTIYDNSSYNQSLEVTALASTL